MRMFFKSSWMQISSLALGLLGLHCLFPQIAQVISTGLALVFCILAFASLASLKESQKTMFWSILSFTCAASSVWDTILSAQWEWVIAAIVGGGIGWAVTRTVSMIHLPQLMAFFHGLVGMATALLSLVLIFMHGHYAANIAIQTRLELAIGGVMAAMTLTGSLIAGAKLHGWLQQNWSKMISRPMIWGCAGITLVSGIVLILWPNVWWMLGLLITSAVLGAAIVLPVGGADMPVVISLLNACSGWATLGIGFSLQHPLYIVVGSIVGFSGAVLSWIMCRGMNRSIKDVLFPKNASSETVQNSAAQGAVQSLSASDAAFILNSASRVVIIPGYGMAAAHAQHVLHELSGVLSDHHIQIHYAIHPVAGRMPGHMNVLLAEAKVPYESMLELDESNVELGQCDVALIIGANDIVNTLAKTDSSSSIYGMPIFNLDKVKTILIIKRSMAAGYAGLDNPLFYQSNTFMVFGDAKKVCAEILKETCVFSRDEASRPDMR
jgi:NAD(P) transhydrogenase subunit beta